MKLKWVYAFIWQVGKEEKKSNNFVLHSSIFSANSPKRGDNVLWILHKYYYVVYPSKSGKTVWDIIAFL